MTVNYPYGDPSTSDWSGGSYTITTTSPNTGISVTSPNLDPFSTAPSPSTVDDDLAWLFRNLKTCVVCGADADTLILCAGCKESVLETRREHFRRQLEEME